MNFRFARSLAKEALTGEVAPGNEEFQSAIKQAVPLGWVFKQAGFDQASKQALIEHAAAFDRASKQAPPLREGCSRCVVF
eukprot:1160971-Pelagomonas_calceolata.AAC.4